jgi:benzodiazapine receptor
MNVVERWIGGTTPRVAASIRPSAWTERLRFDQRGGEDWLTEISFAGQVEAGLPCRNINRSEEQNLQVSCSLPCSDLPLSDLPLAGRAEWLQSADMSASLAASVRPVVYAVVAIAVVSAAGFIANLATIPKIPAWYAGLVKPSFSPPNWLFGPVWAVLYLMMAVAFWRILRLPAATPGRSIAIVVFLVQMALNALWSVTFFGLHAMLGGLLELWPKMGDGV